jgi:hypothetical protein
MRRANPTGADFGEESGQIGLRQKVTTAMCRKRILAQRSQWNSQRAQNLPSVFARFHSLRTLRNPLRPLR